jgi:hypothetical protein
MITLHGPEGVVAEGQACAARPDYLHASLSTHLMGVLMPRLGGGFGASTNRNAEAASQPGH